MHVTLVVDDVPFDVWLTRVEDRVEVEVDGETFEFDAALDGDVVRLDGGDAPHAVAVRGFGRIDVDGTPLRATVARFEAGGGPGAHGARHGSGGAVRAPMPGKIVEVRKAEGDAVEEDEVVLVLEAMKMQIDVHAPGDGVVSDLAVSVGDAVDAVEVLFTITEGDEQ